MLWLQALSRASLRQLSGIARLHARSSFAVSLDHCNEANKCCRIICMIILELSVSASCRNIGCSSEVTCVGTEGPKSKEGKHVSRFPLPPSSFSDYPSRISYLVFSWYLELPLLPGVLNNLIPLRSWHFVCCLIHSMQLHEWVSQPPFLLS